MGLCAQCLFIHYKQKHEILCLEDTIRSVRSIIATMDETVSGCLDKKHKLLQRMQKKINIFDEEKRKFVDEQRHKVDVLKKYLDDKLTAIVSAFESQTQPDKLELESRIDILSKHIAENGDFLKHLNFLKLQFNEETVPNLLENFLKSGQLINFYRRMSLQEKEQLDFDSVF